MMGRQILRVGSRRVVAGLAGVALAGAGATAGAAQAAASPPTVAPLGAPAVVQAAPVAGGLPETVGADALPSWQINGVIWSQVIVGRTVYVTGSFTKARPPGVAAGGAGEITATNLFAYDLITGDRVTTFNHALNAQGMAIRVSPDQSTVYVAGDFTTVDGQSRGHIAAFRVSDGTLLPWSANLGGQARALAVTDSTVYVGGSFTSANGAARYGLASFARTNAAMTAWAPVTDTVRDVWSMVATPDQTQVVVGGTFVTLNGVAAYGMGALDAVTGATRPWAAQERIRTAGANGAITSLKTDGVNILGTGYAFGAGASFEGSFSATPNGGVINWVNDCLGDHYDVTAMSEVVYAVSHAHNCLVPDGFPDTNPRVRWMKATAFTQAPRGINDVVDAYNWDFRGLQHGELLQWYPDLAFGTYTSAGQAAWAVDGRDGYLALGGEFPRVNGVAQQGITRFALPGLAGARTRGPQAADAGFAPTAASERGGRVRITIPAAYDPDDKALTYEVIRGGVATGIRTVVESTFWYQPSVALYDTLADGSSATYQVRATDSDGNSLWSGSTALTATARPASTTYGDGVLADNPVHYWTFNDSAGPVRDRAGGADLTTSGVTLGAPGIGPWATGATTTSTALAYAASAESQLREVTVEGWVKTTSTSGGRILGFGNNQSTTSGATRNSMVLYLNNSGLPYFSMSDGVTVRAINGAAAIRDGQWHHVAASSGAGGMALFVDGVQVAADTNPPLTNLFPGWWRPLGDQTTSLVSRPTSSALAGTVQELAVYDTVLTPSQISGHNSLGRGQVAAPPTASFTATTDLATAFFDGSASSDPDGPISTWAWNFGDGTTGTGVTTSHTYAAFGTYTVTLTVTDAAGMTGTTTRQVTVRANQAPTASFTSTADLLTVSVDGAGSSDVDGTVTAWAWDFGDGSTSTGPTASHVYAAAGTYSITLTVTDNRGATASTTKAVTVRANEPPVAAFTASVNRTKVTVNGSGSTDPNGNIATYAWDFGDGKTGTGVTATNTYAALGSYVVRLTVTDALGLSSTTTRTVTITTGSKNQAPVATFTHTESGLITSVSAAGSTDNGTIASYTWVWGDGTPNGSGLTATHTYATGGTYPVKLIVTDTQGGAKSVTQSVTVVGGTPVNQVPVAAFTVSSADLVASVNGSGSSDPDGSIASYAWAWGDGTANGSGVSATHTYASAGTYTITLTVTDDKGATASTTRSVTVTAPPVPNQVPVAAFTVSSADLVASVNGSGSSDPDGSIAAYAWAWGDGTANGSGVSATHTYASAGTYTITLTVTDDKGATASTTRSVTVTAPPVDNALAKDAFERTTTSAWGTADLGGAWTVTGTASRWNVTGGVGTFTAPVSVGGTASLTGSSRVDSDTTVTLGLDKVPTGNGLYASLMGRSVTATTDYRTKAQFRADGTVAISLSRMASSVETSLASQVVPGLTLAAGESVTLRLQVTGTDPTTLRVKAWKAGTTEPTAWNLTATDSTVGLQAAGYPAMYFYVTGSVTNAPLTVRVDDFVVKAP